jgi:hypothetical protein
MKTLTKIILVCLAFNFQMSNIIAATNPASSQNIGIHTIDLQALGAISNGDTSNQPSLSELMRDCSVSNKNMLHDSISSQTTDAEITNENFNKEKEYEEYAAEVRSQNRRFAGIITVVLLVFFLIAGFTSPIFRHKTHKIITENSPFSLSRTMLFTWTYGLTSSIFTVWGAMGEFPAWVLSLPLFFGIILITFIFSYLLEKMDTESYTPPVINQFTLAANNSFKPFMCIPKMQFLIISLFHLGLLCAPAWIYFNFNELSPEILVVQMLSSMIYLGHKAFKIQRVHSLLFSKNSNNSNAHA